MISFLAYYSKNYIMRGWLNLAQFNVISFASVTGCTEFVQTKNLIFAAPAVSGVTVAAPSANGSLTTLISAPSASYAAAYASPS